MNDENVSTVSVHVPFLCVSVIVILIRILDLDSLKVYYPVTKESIPFVIILKVIMSSLLTR